MIRLVHAADIHLGRRRLDGRLPDSDFADAFDFIAEQAIEGKADAFLLAGDLFDRAQVEPPHLRQAQAVLGKLKAAGIPVVAIAGNHDKAFLNSAEPTWLDFLADDELLILLNTRFGPDGPQLDPWNPQTRRGAWIDLRGVRFTGAGYLGAATPHKVRAVVDALQPPGPHILLLHAGPGYFVGEGGGFSGEDLAWIRQRVVYLALGHIHRPMLHQGWACNPGSPENCDLAESHYDRDKDGQPTGRGYAWVEIDPASENPLSTVAIRSNPRRPVLHLTLDGTPFGNKLKDGAASLEKAACRLIAQSHPTPDTTVLLTLTGRINLGRVALDLPLASQNIEQAAGVKAVSLDASGINLGEGPSSASSGEALLSREQIERSAIRRLVEEEHLWGLDGEEGAVADLFFELKESVRLGRSVDEMTEQIQLSPLIERIRSTPGGAQAGPADGAEGQPGLL